MNQKILIVDDHKVFCESLKMVLEAHKFYVVNVIDGELALKHLKSGDFDIVITDVEMPKMNGFDFIKEIKAIENELPKIPKYIILTSYSKIKVFKQFYNLGIHAYLSKNVSQLELINVIKKVLKNEKYFEKSIYDEYISSDTNSNQVEFTKRELDVLHLILDEKTTNEIAEKLQISPFTVEGHRKNLMQKTNSKNVVGLIKYAMLNNK
ncbi:response regulator transcription factor [Flavobacterium urocaniciphilum]|uniref:Two component transcriptional regulator, LuxR family n=1 Tax=Flavobacterium urocaniciphilum TaxID=1299341 RepID=A0A1H9E179_9FLAO|nr:response regulator transcription factor [Flavobacterium urocaniciphilum]SEQ18963.1 two component transcriptional regulator, LuxR family [Flavobacterium urocaniciphilum]